MNKSFLTVLLTLSVITSLASGTPQETRGVTFQGSVMVQGQPAADTTRVYATSGAHISNVVEVQNGRYSNLILAPDGGLPEGTRIVFFIGGGLTSPSESGPTAPVGPCVAVSNRPGTLGVEADDTSVFSAGQTLELNITLFDSDRDTDGDGLSDSDELSGASGYFTEPSLNDTDADGVSDGAEVNGRGTNPLVRDTECDGSEDGTDMFPTIDNQLILNSLISILGLFAAGALLFFQWRLGLTPARRAAIRIRRDEDEKLKPLVEQLLNIVHSSEAGYHGYIRLQEVMTELAVDEETARKSLKKMDAKLDGEYYIVP